MKIGVVNYDAGNLGSISSALRALNLNFSIVGKPEEIANCDSIIIPGVGAFGFGMDHLEASGMGAEILGHFNSGKQIIGICLGMHLLATSGFEGSLRSGLGVIPGVVRRLESSINEKVPHLGWDRIQSNKKERYSETDYYFAHSYYFDLDASNSKHTVATFEWGNELIPAVIEFNNCTAIQFHPEKSGIEGLKLLSGLFSRDSS